MFEQEAAGGGGDGATQSERGNYVFLKGTRLTDVEGMHQFIMCIMYVVQPGRRGEVFEGVGGGYSFFFGGKAISDSFRVRS